MATLFLTACGDRNSRPEIVLTPQDSLLAEALATLQLAEARIETSVPDGDSLRSLAYATIAEDTGYDSLMIAAAFDDLASDPDRAGAILGLITNRLSNEQRGLLP